MSSASAVREGSHPDFCPPVEEGVAFAFQDEAGDVVSLEFLGLLMHKGVRYGFFFPLDDGQDALGSGEVVVLEVTGLDDDGQPDAFEAVEDAAIVAEVWERFKQATRDLYRFG